MAAAGHQQDCQPTQLSSNSNAVCEWQLHASQQRRANSTRTSAPEAANPAADAAQPDSGWDTHQCQGASMTLAYQSQTRNPSGDDPRFHDLVKMII
ncbi:hypothetical protein Nepgr_005761 [Nepenthes gracilis]|uniref:Uncharacterized protein n=1 Tax=Nepenthes gracilis TaxID=150966 RepID=A0AAD3S3S9_NEPGR|nr:hypothetical protein Nepgr_005761 [Nepenthes gracilis]